MKVRVLHRNGSVKSYNFESTNESKSIYRIFDDDTLFDIRHKIALATGIPIYAQHITNSEGLGCYILRAEGYPYEINAHELLTPVRWIETELGLPYDNIIYENRKNLRIECHDHEYIASLLPPIPLEVIDAREFIDPNRGIIRDNITYLEMIYYGFIVKYWPIISYEVFQDLLFQGEEEVLSKYVNLETHREFVSRQTKTIERLEAVKRPVELSLLISNAIISNNSFLSPINLDNLFDVFETCPEYPSVSFRGVRKEWIETTTRIAINYPSQLKNGVIFAILLPTNEQLFMAVEEMSLHIRIALETERITSFRQHIDLIDKYVNPLVRRINGQIEYLSANEIPLLTIHNTRHKTITCNMFWRKMISSLQYDDLREQIEEYFRSNIFHYYNRLNFETGSNLVFYFLRGGESNPRKIASKIPENTNYYWFLTNETIAEIWNNTFIGSPVKMKHLFSDICFEITNIREINFIILKRYLGNILSLARIRKDVVKSGGRVKRLRKLQEYDPLLYNLRDGNIANENKLYSIICQGPNQPIIYSKDEIRDMSSSKKKKLVEYWNFTYEEPAYYECPDSEYPHFMFMTGYHPKGYCLPCCKKRSISQIVKEVSFFKTCMIKHIYTGEDQAEDDISSKNRSYLFEFGREPLSPNRIGTVPNIEKILPISHSGEESSQVGNILASVGVKQIGHMSRKYGIVNSIAYLLDVPANNLTLRGDDVEELCIEVVKKYRIQPIILTVNGPNINISYNAKYNSTRAIFILHKPEAYEPVVILNVAAYSQTFEVIQKIWEWKTRPRMMNKLISSKEVITLSSSPIGSIVNGVFYPASSIAIDDDTEFISFSKQLTTQKAPTSVATSIRQTKVRNTYRNKTWSYDQFIWTSRDNIPHAKSIEWKYPPEKIISAIDSGAPGKDMRYLGEDRATYKILFYHMLVMELSKYFSRGKNKQIRQQILDTVNRTNWNHLKTLVGPEDLPTIMKQINTFSKQAFAAAMDKSVYNFDRSDYYDLLTLDKTSMRAQLVDIVSELTTVMPKNHDFEFINNMITYKPVKVQVYPEIVGDMSRYIDMLVADLTNPIKTYMFGINLELHRTGGYKKRKGERIISAM